MRKPTYQRIQMALVYVFWNVHRLLNVWSMGVIDGNERVSQSRAKTLAVLI